MRTFLILCLLIAGSALLQAQAPATPREQSNIEKFSAKSGTLIEKQFVDIGSVKRVKVQLLIITDMMAYRLIIGFIVASRGIIRLRCVRFANCSGAALMSGIASLNRFLRIVLRLTTSCQNEEQQKYEKIG